MSQINLSPDTPGLKLRVSAKKGHLIFFFFPFIHGFLPGMNAVPAPRDGATRRRAGLVPCHTASWAQPASKGWDSCSGVAQGAIATQQFLFLKTWKIVRTLSLRVKKKKKHFYQGKKKAHIPYMIQWWNHKWLAIDLQVCRSLKYPHSHNKPVPEGRRLFLTFSPLIC